MSSPNQSICYDVLKSISGTALLFLLHCMSLNGNEAIVVGGFSETRGANLDLVVINLVAKVRPEIEEKENEIFELFQPVSYKKQFLDGSIYKVKVIYDDGYMDLIVFRLLAKLKQEPVLMVCKKATEKLIYTPWQRVDAPVE